MLLRQTQSYKSYQKHKNKNRIEVPLKNLKNFYQGFIIEIIRPSFNDFFILYPQIDILNQQKDQKNQDQNKQQQKIVCQYQQTPVFSNIKIRKQKKNQQNLHKSKLQVFTLHRQHKHNQINSNLSSIQNKNIYEQKQQNFLFNEQAIFYLISGNLQLHKPVYLSAQDQLQKKFQKKEINKEEIFSNKNILSNQISFCNKFLQNQLIKSKQNQLITKNPTFSSNLPIFLRKKQTGSIKIYKKAQQIRQNSFLSLLNYKNLFNNQKNQQNNSPQFYKIILKSSSCTLLKIPINSAFGFDYLYKQTKKLNCLSSIFLNSQKSDFINSSIFINIFNSFQQEIIKINMNLCEEGKKNKKIYIADTQGELIVEKDLFFRKQHNILEKTTFKVKNLTGIQIFNAEIFIQNSQKINNLINKNKFTQNNNFQSKDQQRSDQNKQFNTKKNSKINKSISNIQENKQNTHEKKQLYLEQNCKKQVFLGLAKRSFLKFFNFPLDFSNFTVNNQSAAYFTIYSIDLQNFIKLQLPQRLKNNLLKKQQQFIISCLTRSIQKLNKFQQYIQIHENLKINQFQQYAILAGFATKNQRKTIYSSLQNNKSQKQEQNKIQISLSKLQLYNKENYEGLKINPIAISQSQNIQTKIQLIKNNQQKLLNKQKVPQNYKQKIQTLITQNLKIINQDNNNFDLFLSPNISKNVQNNYKQISNVYQAIVSQIFMQPNHKKNDNAFKYNQILRKNQHILVKKIKKEINVISKQSPFNYNKEIQNEFLMQKDIFDPLFNQFIKINLIKKGHPDFKKNKNYLKGIQISQFTDLIKNNFAQKINRTNKIKQQFIKIQSKCQNCHCYDNLDEYKTFCQIQRPGTQINSRNSIIKSSNGIRNHTMKIGINWKTRYPSSSLTNYQIYSQKISQRPCTTRETKTIGKTIKNNKIPKDYHMHVNDNQPFQKVYNRLKVIKQKSLEKYNFNEHLLNKKNQLLSRRQKKKSVPLLAL